MLLSKRHDRRGRRNEGDTVADSLFGVGWLLVLVFSAGGFAGMLLASLMHMASANSAREWHRDWRE